MYMTSFPVNTTRRAARAMLASPYKLHAAVAGSFPGGAAPGDEGRVLWRVDRDGNGNARLYVVSPAAPSMVGLDEQVGWPDLDEPQWKTRDYGPFLDGIEAGQRYAFRLTANPVASRSGEKDAKGRSKRMGHQTTLQQEAWLAGPAAFEAAGCEVPEAFPAQGASRAERNGFRVVGGDGAPLQLVVSRSGYDTFKDKRGNRVSVAKAQYDGVLEVVDADKLRHALCFGIGHAKGFGCGLLTLAPLG